MCTRHRPHLWQRPRSVLALEEFYLRPVLVLHRLLTALYPVELRRLRLPLRRQLAGGTMRASGPSPGISACY